MSVKPEALLLAVLVAWAPCLAAQETPDQQAKFDALVKAGPDRMWPGPGRFMGPPPPADPPDR